MKNNRARALTTDSLPRCLFRASISFIVPTYRHFTTTKKMATNSIIESLRQQILSCEAQLQDLRQRLAEAENRRYQQLEEEEGLRRSYTLTANDDPLSHDMNHGIADAFCSEVYAALSPHTTSTAEQTTTPAAKRAWPLDKAEYKRYGRQLIMPEVGLQGTFFSLYAFYDIAFFLFDIDNFFLKKDFLTEVCIYMEQGNFG